MGRAQSRFGDLVVVGFMLMQCLDAVFTYLGISIWGPASRPTRSSARPWPRPASLGGLGGAKVVAIGFGMLLHLRRVHNLVALLTAIYFAVAILPWTALFFSRVPNRSCCSSPGGMRRNSRWSILRASSYTEDC